MAAIKNVALIGAAGAVGTPVLDALLRSKFNVTVVARKTSSSTYPTSVNVARADFSSLESLTAALQGQDALISTIGTEGLSFQSHLIDAAIAAGVSRIIPSEFGCDLSNQKTSTLPVFGFKVATRKYIAEKIKNGTNISYTYIICGPFLDWGIENNFLLAWNEGKPTIYDSGDQIFSSTSLASVADAVVGVLSHPEESKNRSVFVEDIKISQNQLLAAAKEANPERVKEWQFQHVKAADIEKNSSTSFGEGDHTHSVVFQNLLSGIFGEGFGSIYEKNDNELLGVQGNKTMNDVVDIWKKCLSY